MSERAIEISGVRKRFGSRRVVEGVDLEVAKGEIFVLLGRNGAGKTTLIRTLLGLLRPDGGSVRVLGFDPRRGGLEVRRRVGYLAEDEALYGWMRVSGAILFVAPFYPTWDADLAERYRRLFDLPPRARVRDLSKGQKVRLGLLLALAHRPEVVLLDDPTMGLDPILRKEFLRDVVTHLQESGATVLFSSHLLYEVEPVADSLAILDRGRIVRRASAEKLREEVKRLIVPAEAIRRPPGIPGVLDVRTSDGRAAVTVEEARGPREVRDPAGGRRPEPRRDLRGLRDRQEALREAALGPEDGGPHGGPQEAPRERREGSRERLPPDAGSCGRQGGVSAGPPDRPSLPVVTILGYPGRVAGRGFRRPRAREMLMTIKVLSLVLFLFAG